MIKHPRNDEQPNAPQPPMESFEVENHLAAAGWLGAFYFKKARHPQQMTSQALKTIQGAPEYTVRNRTWTATEPVALYVPPHYRRVCVIIPM